MTKNIDRDNDNYIAQKDSRGKGIMLEAKRHKGKREKECVDQWALLT